MAFQQVDVFTTTPYMGNPLAVVLDADGLSADQMQRFANWMNLSQTMFVVPPSALGTDYQVRIFTPRAELPLAGHPTLGTCHAWLSLSRSPGQGGLVVQRCAVALIPVRRTSDGLALASPPLVLPGYRLGCQVLANWRW